MADIICIHCRTQNRLAPFNDLDNLITQRCWRCRNLTPTGREDQVRSVWERWGGRYPKYNAARAIAMSNNIWKNAKKGKTEFNFDKTQKKIRKSVGLSRREAPFVVRKEFIMGRTHRGFTDGSMTAAVIVIDNRRNLPRYSIFVVFRGSASSIMSVDDPTVNVDWRANFDNSMSTTGYCDPKIRVHQGFLISTRSYRDKVIKALRSAMSDFFPYHVVVTGHSQGGGHAVLFSHWLEYVESQARAACIPFSAPRVGNFAFARDFTRRVTRRLQTLPFDGHWQGAYLMVKGEDPVVFSQKHAFHFHSVQERRRIADSDNMYKQATGAMHAEKYHSDPVDIYFHPHNLVQLSSKVPKIGLIKGIDHHPGLFRDRVFDDF